MSEKEKSVIEKEEKTSGKYNKPIFMVLKNSKGKVIAVNQFVDNEKLKQKLLSEGWAEK